MATIKGDSTDTVHAAERGDDGEYGTICGTWFKSATVVNPRIKTGNRASVSYPITCRLCLNMLEDPWIRRQVVHYWLLEDDGQTAVPEPNEDVALDWIHQNKTGICVVASEDIEVGEELVTVGTHFQCAGQDHLWATIVHVEDHGRPVKSFHRLEWLYGSRAEAEAGHELAMRVTRAILEVMELGEPVSSIVVAGLPPSDKPSKRRILLSGNS